ncbi:TetR family transcriptional regulator [Murinocardiopsis flavida]|uniref:TetR family transcriptional regulator n=1 Tax=Murinocardiopsis flavida TaxID=645275 RepID=A0A2P8DK98_9ACTN|nr:TetR/AcrR family transcriptional regulator [Murinocardiopsis flavida]PSK97652.1 TetR family transcriptional regulator [Murinocardiopsis flavida]
MDEAKRAPKRQARGERRIAQILESAAEVFADAGFEAATTNAIAARAGISPGSLYQFFANKDAVARALAERYVAELGAAQAAAFGPADLAELPLQQVIERVTEPLIAFNLANRGFKTLFARTDMPPALVEATAPLNGAVHRRIDALLQVRAPGLARADRERTATVAIQLVRGLMPLIVAAEGDERDRLVRDLRGVLASYLADVWAEPPARD